MYNISIKNEIKCEKMGQNTHTQKRKEKENKVKKKK